MLDWTGYDGAAALRRRRRGLRLRRTAPASARARPASTMEEGDAEVLPVVASAPVTFGASSVFGAVEGAASWCSCRSSSSRLGYSERARRRGWWRPGASGSSAFQYLVGQAADRDRHRAGADRLRSDTAAVFAALLPLADDRLAHALRLRLRPGRDDRRHLDQRAGAAGRPLRGAKAGGGQHGLRLRLGARAPSSGPAAAGAIRDSDRVRRDLLRRRWACSAPTPWPRSLRRGAARP